MSSANTAIEKELQMIPENGSVVIIDDQPNEALPIVKSLSKKGIASTYYQGNVKDELPDKPVQNVRLLFLDLQIIDSSDEHQIAKSIVNVLLKIVSEKNGPYLLVIWSKKYHTYEKAVKEEINKHKHLVPACIVNINKSACLESKRILPIETDSFIERLTELLEGKIGPDDMREVGVAVAQALGDEYKTEFEAKPDAVRIIEEQLKTELLKSGCFHLFVLWENIVKRAAAKMTYEVSSLINNDEHWEINTKNVFKRMAIARVGKNQVPEEVLIRESINTLNLSLVDNIEHEMKGVEIPAHIKLESEIVCTNKTDKGNFSLKDSPGTELEILRSGVSLKKAKDKKKLRSSVVSDKRMDAGDREYSLKLLDAYDLLPASLNTKLHIELEPSQELIPGNIYLSPEQKKKVQYIESFMEKIEGQPEEYILIDLEVSPICDYAQDKWKRSRTLPGLMYPAKYSGNKKSGANLYPVNPVFVIDKIEYKLIFDYHLFYASDKASAKQRHVSYRLKRELLLDVIAQLSSHVNRPGISFIE